MKVAFPDVHRCVYFFFNACDCGVVAAKHLAFKGNAGRAFADFYLKAFLFERFFCFFKQVNELRVRAKPDCFEFFFDKFLF